MVLVVWSTESAGVGPRVLEVVVSQKEDTHTGDGGPSSHLPTFGSQIGRNTDIDRRERLDFGAATEEDA